MPRPVPMPDLRRALLAALDDLAADPTVSRAVRLSALATVTRIRMADRLAEIRRPRR